MTFTVENLCVRLGETVAVADANLTVQRGRVTAIIGPNGAGKTSLIRALAGLVPYSGTVTLDGIHLNALSLRARAKRIGYLPQNGSPAWNVSVRELVALGRIPHRSPFAALSAIDQDHIDAALRATDTMDFAGRPIETLSGGERARVKMARILAGTPDWIIADEPLANLDPPHERDLLDLLRISVAQGCGAIVILHQLNAVARVADDIVMMKKGDIVAFGPSDDILTARNLEATFGMRFEIIAQRGQIAILPVA